MKTIKALVSFVYIGANGSITSYAGGQVYEVANEIATQMISIGYAEEYSGGGGGSSDFSTAEVTMSSVNFMPLPYIKDGYLVYEYPEEVGVYEVPIPSNGGTIITLDRNIPIIATGSATVVNNEKAQTTIVTITGDCTLTVED